MLPLVFAAAVVSGPEVVLRIDPSHQLVEGVATDGSTIWVSSVLDRMILACRRECRKLAVFPTSQHPLGISWDRARNRLWVTVDCPHLTGVKPCDKGALLELDRHGKVRALLQPRGLSFHPGDVSSSRSSVVVGDSSNGAVYKVSANGRSLATVIAPGIGKSAQDSGVDENRKRLIIADYGVGLARVDIPSLKRVLIPQDDGAPLRGLDGMAVCGGQFYAIENGASPPSLLHLVFRRDTVKAERVLAGPILPDPTQVAAGKQRLLVVADSGWEQVSKPGPRQTPATIIAVPLGKGCRP